MVTVSVTGDLRVLSGVDHVLFLHLQPAAAYGVIVRCTHGQGRAGRHGSELCGRDVDTRTVHHSNTATDNASYVSQNSPQLLPVKKAVPIAQIPICRSCFHVHQ